MDEFSQKQVCLLIDFENLIYGLFEMYGEERYIDEVDINVLFNLATEYGNVVIANAYADWRSRTVNQFQLDLYRLGAELVHVMGKPNKNAVDVKMAVDAVELMWKYPNVQTYLIVSGDRDFIHVLKALRRHGKTVIGVAPHNSTSDDFAALCDRFLRYSALVSTYSAIPAPAEEVRPTAVDFNEVRSALRRILAEYADEGLKGAKIKPLLRRELSQTFDQSEYGFPKMAHLLRAMPDVARIESSDAGEDILVFPADRPSGNNHGQAARNGLRGEPLIEDLIQRSGISLYRFERNAQRRRSVLEAIHRHMLAIMTEQESFVWSDVADAILEDVQDARLSVTVLSKYHTVLWQSYAFDVLPDQNVPVKQRRIRLKRHLLEFDAFCRNYEQSIAYKVLNKMNEGLTPELLCRVLGLEPETPEDIQYSGEVLEAAHAKANLR